MSWLFGTNKPDDVSPGELLEYDGMVFLPPPSLPYSLKNLLESLLIFVVYLSFTASGRRPPPLRGKGRKQRERTAYSSGLFMLGGPTSPVNRLIIPALKYIVWYCNQNTIDDPKRRSILTALANACLDCQQVQARVILKVYRELTNQHQTFPLQISTFLNALKDQAINDIITHYHHPSCDYNYTRVKPYQQRPHLRSAYIATFGKKLGLPDITPSKSDRFLHQAVSEMKKKITGDISEMVMGSISSKDFFQNLLGDINNQSLRADRWIDRNTIFNWAKENMKKNPHVVFYDQDNKHEYEDQSPSKPTPQNQFNVFLSRKILLKMLQLTQFLTPVGILPQPGAPIVITAGKYAKTEGFIIKKKPEGFLVKTKSGEITVSSEDVKVKLSEKRTARVLGPDTKEVKNSEALEDEEEWPEGQRCRKIKKTHNPHSTRDLGSGGLQSRNPRSPNPTRHRSRKTRKRKRGRIPSSLDSGDHRNPPRNPILGPGYSSLGSEEGLRIAAIFIVIFSGVAYCCS
ncbi:hypothetical protein AAMO2058_000463600 [Amorphochlora amoebiformis]